MSGVWVGAATIGGAALSYMGAREQAKATRKAAKIASQGTELPVYTGYGPGGLRAGIGVPTRGRAYSWEQLLNRQPFTRTGNSPDGFGINLGELDASRYGLVNLAQQNIGRAGLAGITPEMQNAVYRATAFGMPTDPSSRLTQQQLARTRVADTGAWVDLQREYTPDYNDALALQANLGVSSALQDASLTGDQSRTRTLDLLREQARPFEDRAMQDLQQRLFSTGQIGTTGGGLQTEAFARGLAQADLSRQLTAAQEGRDATKFALNQAGRLSEISGGYQSLGDQLLQSAFGRFGTTQEMLGGLGQRMYDRNIGMQELTRSRGLEDLQALFGASVLPAQMQQAWLSPAITALQGQSGLQEQGLQSFNAGLALAQAQANARNKAGSNVAALAGSANFGSDYRFAANLLTGIGSRMGNSNNNNLWSNLFSSGGTAPSSSTDKYGISSSSNSGANNPFNLDYSV